MVVRFALKKFGEGIVNKTVKNSAEGENSVLNKPEQNRTTWRGIGSKRSDLQI
jgi:hypothetical protein